MSPTAANQSRERIPGPGWLSNRTPISNLFLAGAWTNSGGMNPAIGSGVDAARHILGESPALP